MRSEISVPDLPEELHRQRLSLRAASGIRPTEVLTLVEVMAALVFVESALRWVPLGRLAGWLGVQLSVMADDRRVPSSLPEAGFGPRELRKVYLARKMLLYWPFGAGTCLRETLVVGHILRRHQPALRLGVARLGSAVTAHAWLEVGGVSLEADRGFLPLGRHDPSGHPTTSRDGR